MAPYRSVPLAHQTECPYDPLPNEIDPVPQASSPIRSIFDLPQNIQSNANAPPGLFAGLNENTRSDENCDKPDITDRDGKPGLLPQPSKVSKVAIPAAVSYFTSSLDRLKRQSQNQSSEEKSPDETGDKEIASADSLQARAMASKKENKMKRKYTDEDSIPTDQVSIRIVSRGSFPSDSNSSPKEKTPKTNAPEKPIIDHSNLPRDISLSIRELENGFDYYKLESDRTNLDAVSFHAQLQVFSKVFLMLATDGPAEFSDRWEKAQQIEEGKGAPGVLCVGSEGSLIISLRSAYECIGIVLASNNEIIQKIERFNKWQGSELEKATSAVATLNDKYDDQTKKFLGFMLNLDRLVTDVDSIRAYGPGSLDAIHDDLKGKFLALLQDRSDDRKEYGDRFNNLRDAYNNKLAEHKRNLTTTQHSLSEANGKISSLQNVINAMISEKGTLSASRDIALAKIRAMKAEAAEQEQRKESPTKILLDMCTSREVWLAGKLDEAKARNVRENQAEKRSSNKLKRAIKQAKSLEAPPDALENAMEMIDKRVNEVYTAQKESKAHQKTRAKHDAKTLDVSIRKDFKYWAEKSPYDQSQESHRRGAENIKLRSAIDKFLVSSRVVDPSLVKNYESLSTLPLKIQEVKCVYDFAPQHVDACEFNEVAIGSISTPAAASEGSINHSIAFTSAFDDNDQATEDTLSSNESAVCSILTPAAATEGSTNDSVAFTSAFDDNDQATDDTLSSNESAVDSILTPATATEGSTNDSVAFTFAVNKNGHFAWILTLLSIALFFGTLCQVFPYEPCPTNADLLVTGGLAKFDFWDFHLNNRMNCIDLYDENLYAVATFDYTTPWEWAIKYQRENKSQLTYNSTSALDAVDDVSEDEPCGYKAYCWTRKGIHWIKSHPRYQQAMVVMPYVGAAGAAGFMGVTASWVYYGY